MKKIRTIVLFVSLLFLLSGCSNFVWICKETKKTIKNAKKHTDYTALTVEGLRNMFRSDTTHYKIVDFYSICCGPCMFRFQNVYPTQIRRFCKNDNAKIYFIQENTGSLKYSEKFLSYMSQYDSDTSKYKYYLRDTNYKYSYTDTKGKKTNSDVLTNLTNDLFDNSEFVLALGLPHTFIVNKEGNKIMIQPGKFSDGNVAYIPLALDDLNCPLDSLDFNSVWPDTLYIPFEMPKNYKQFCTPDGKCTK